MRGFIALSALFLLTPTVPLSGEDLPVPTAAEVLSIGSDIPGRLTVPVTIGDAGPYPFTIDTGAQRTVISHELARLLGLSRGRNVRITAMTGSSTVGTVLIPSLRVSSIGADRIEAPTFRGEDLGAPGLLGLDSLKGRAVTINFDTNLLTVVRSTKRSARDYAGRDEIVIRAKNVFGQLVVTDADYHGQRVRVVLDTGSATSIGNLALLHLIDRSEGGRKTVGLISVTGERMEAEYTQVSDIRLGTIKFQHLPIAFADARPFELFGLSKRPALLLGIDALRQFRRVDIDFANREVRLATPRSVF